MLDRRRTGLIIIGFSIALLMSILFESFAFQEVNKVVHSSCGLPDAVCPANNILPNESLLPLTINVFLLLFGVYMVIPQDNKSMRPKRAPPGLSDEEKKVYSLVSQNNAMLQSELVDKAGINKVKLTRILDKLEAKQLIERHRRGMTNLVKVKPDSD